MSIRKEPDRLEYLGVIAFENGKKAERKRIREKVVVMRKAAQVINLDMDCENNDRNCAGAEYKAYGKILALLGPES